MDEIRTPSVNGKYKEQWKNLLCAERVCVNESARSDDLTDGVKPADDRLPFERDYERVVFSSGFRRLAGKTQVRTFPDVDFIHNRLTHSLEVSSIARSLGAAIAKFLCVDRGDIAVEDQEKIIWIAQAAGIAHDLGNPPYGHSGEHAIQDWARKLPVTKLYASNDVWKDFMFYDGNAQTFRLLCSPETRNGLSFMFTAASAGALVKYPKVSTEFSGSENEWKFDVFSNDKDLYEKIWSKLGLDVSRHQRHPLSYLSEAADDICYRVLDFEDAVISGVVAREEVVGKFREGLGLPPENDDNRIPLSKLRSRLIRMLVNEFVDCFKSHYEQIMEGNFSDDLRKGLPDTSSSKKFLKEIGKLYDRLYTEHNKVVRECGAYSQIPIMLNRGYDFIAEVFGVGNNAGGELPAFDTISHYSQHFVTLAWGKNYYEHNRDKNFEWWMHMLLDYVVGMTDAYINMLSQKLI